MAGHRGLVGSAIIRNLIARGYKSLVFQTSEELDLRDQRKTRHFLQKEKPEYVFLAAARVGGIWANSTRPAEFIFDNLMMQTNLIHESYRVGVKKLLFLGSSCIFPKVSPQPLKESYLLTGPLEETNEMYAVAKIAGIKLCQAYNKQYGTAYISVMPANLYGPGDNFDLATSHVLPALIRKFDEAKQLNLSEVAVWGTGAPRREFLHVDDLAEACMFLMTEYCGSEPINIGTGNDLTIAELANIVREITGYQGKIRFDHDKPDGTPAKRLDISRITRMGWTAKTELREGIRRTYEWYLANRSAICRKAR